MVWLSLQLTMFKLKMTQENNQEIKSEKRYTTAVILSGVFGVVGIHHFYVERWGMGLLDLGLFIATVVLYFSEYFIVLEDYSLLI